jgi:hypothetical protein
MKALLNALILTLAMSSLSACGAAPMYAGERAPTPMMGGSNAPQARLMARTARITLEVDDEDDFGPTLDQLEALAGEFKGHVVERTQRRLVLKVPAERLDETIGRLGKLGEITERWVGAVDVTDQHTDLSVRIANQQRLQARLRELVAQSEDVATVLNVEKELARVTTELERLEAQLRGINGRVALARVAVQLEEEVSPGPIGWVGYGLWVGVKWLFVWD